MSVCSRSATNLHPSSTPRERECRSWNNWTSGSCGRPSVGNAYYTIVLTLVGARDLLLLLFLSAFRPPRPCRRVSSATRTTRFCCTSRCSAFQRSRRSKAAILRLRLLLFLAEAARAPQPRPTARRSTIGSRKS